MIVKGMELENIKLGDWLDIWFETYKKPYLKPYSIRNIEQQIRLHTPLWLKEMPIKNIALFDIDRALMSIPLGRTRKYTRQVWHSAFRKAQQLGVIDNNVLTLTDDIRYKKQCGRALTMTEQSDFLKALQGKRYENIMRFYLYTGVRRAEALSLEWSDIDYDRKLILIKGTKTEDSYRHILLTDEVQEILERQRMQNEAEKDSRGENKRNGYVFDYSLAYLSQAFKKICPNHHLHDLRHTYITRCAECGVSVAVCQQLVGHSTADMTMNVYTHVMDEFKRKEALKFTIYPKY